MKVLVTGGTGFVGQTLVRRILENGWNITLITRNKAHAPAASSNQLSVYETDVTDAEFLRELARREKTFDAVIHMAASLQYFGDKDQVYRINVDGTRNILELAQSTGVKCFIYASSIEATGMVSLKEVPAPLKTRCRPASVYGASKVAAEGLVKSMAEGHFTAKILRIGNVYGPNHMNSIVQFAQAILTRSRILEFLPIYKDRYIHPVFNEDVTDGIMAAFNNDSSFGIYNLAGEYATVGEIFEMIAEILGKNLPPQEWRKLDWIYLLLVREYRKYCKSSDFLAYIMAGHGRRIHRAYSMSETKEGLGFIPRTSLRVGIEKTLIWAMETGLLN